MRASYFVKLGLPEELGQEIREAFSRIVTGIASRFSFQGLEDWSVDLAPSTKVLGAEREFHDLRSLARMKPEMRVYFARKTDAASFARLMRASVEGLKVSSPRKLAAKDWMKEWRKVYKTQILRSGKKRIAIVPAWKKSPESIPSVRVQPGQAFGTGTHPTTRLCLEVYLDHSLNKRGTVLDFGAGTGVLALGALAIAKEEGVKLSAIAVESDPEALKQCGKNARLNKRRVRLLKKMPVGKFDFVFANVLAPVLVAYRSKLKARVRKGGLLVVSGLLKSDQAFLPAFCQKGLDLVETREEGEWIAHLFRRQ